MHPLQSFLSPLFRPLIQNCISLSSSFDVLGPFQIGTRGKALIPSSKPPLTIPESAWGTDILGARGGFQNLEYDPEARFHSSIAKGGFVSWTRFNNFTRDGYLNLKFEKNINWKEAQSAYGWAGLQFQAWARGEIEACENARVRINVENAVEFWINGKKYFGDVYGFGTAPAIINLKQGLNTIEVKTAGDIRATGGGVPPTIAVKIQIKRITEDLVVDPSGWKLPDIVEGRLAGQFGSLAVRNEGESTIEILGIGGEHAESRKQPHFSEASDLHWNEWIGYLVDRFPVVVFPGQSRPVRFYLRNPHRYEHFKAKSPLCFEVVYKHQGLEGDTRRVQACHEVKEMEDIFLPHTFTYPHSSGIISHGVIRTPKPKVYSKIPDNEEESWERGPWSPILLSLHGSGVDVRKEEFRNVYQEKLSNLYAWIVMPSGVTHWAGDDWHIWGGGDALAAVENGIGIWRESMRWETYALRGFAGPWSVTTRVVVTGHSNGGQGAWHFGAHRGTQVRAIAPLSGFFSIQTYVPYSLWHSLEPKKQAIIDAALNNHRLELFVENLAGTPILHQHGELDDNVPPYHSRLFSQLLSEHRIETDYHELPGRGHWWEGVMTDGGIPDFLTKNLLHTKDKPPLPNRFSIVVASPADTGRNKLIKIEQLENPAELGRIDVVVEDEGRHWKLTTRNVRRFSMERVFSVWDHLSEETVPRSISIEGYFFEPLRSRINYKVHHYFRDGSGWEEVGEDWSKSNTERSNKQLGPMEGILRTDGPFWIVLPKRPTEAEIHAAKEIARSFFIHLGADSMISEKYEAEKEFELVHAGVRICVSIGRVNTNCAVDPDLPIPIQIMDEKYVLNTVDGTVDVAKEKESGAIFLVPSRLKCADVHLYATTEAAFNSVASLLPFRTGSGVPDFVIMGDKPWKGVAGATALGFFDSHWKASKAWAFY